MKITETKIKGLLLLEPEVFEDTRGFFMETYRKSELDEAGVNTEFVQENHSKSIGKVLRGLHFQVAPFSQTKLIRCIVGSIWDVAVDIRPDSATFGEWYGIELSQENKKQLFIPDGFAHGFCTLSDEVEVIYKCGNYYSKADERGIIWNDADLKIDWPIENAIISEKDLSLPAFKNLNLEELKK